MGDADVVIPRHLGDHEVVGGHVDELPPHAKLVSLLGFEKTNAE